MGRFGWRWTRSARQAAVALAIGSVALTTSFAHGPRTHADSGEAPSVQAVANAPGWITVQWTHSGVDTYWYNIERQDVPNSVQRQYGASGTYTDTGLTANTIYTYRVCAVFAYSQACSGWVSARTFAAPPPPPPPAPVQQAVPELSATAVGSNAIDLRWTIPFTDTITHISLERDGHSYKEFNGLAGYSFLDVLVRPNTPYTYRVCISAGTKQVCSATIPARGTAYAPNNLKGILGDRGVELRWTTDNYGDDYLQLERQVNGTWAPVGGHLAPYSGVALDAHPVLSGQREGHFEYFHYRVCSVNTFGRTCSGTTKVFNVKDLAPIPGGRDAAERTQPAPRTIPLDTPVVPLDGSVNNNLDRLG